jgi:DNA ligase 1
VVKILTGDTRIGLKEGLLEEAIAEAYGQSSELAREAHMLTGDIGQAAIMAAQGGLEFASLQPFQPIKVMLASPKETAAELWEKLGTAGVVWLEDKFDGIRAQLHKEGKQADLYSRDLRSLAREFPDVVQPALALGYDAVFDGEIIAHHEGKRLTFFDLQKRLGRRQAGADLFLAEDIPVRYVIFDLLWLNGRSLLKTPLEDRRRLLDTLDIPKPFEKIALHRAHHESEINAAFRAARAAGNEGLIAKDPSSLYASGRRGQAWLKLKRSDLSLDVVVVAAEQGHGKRSHVLSDYTFAVRDEKDGSLKVIGKAYSGLTDAEIEELTAHFTATTESMKRQVRQVTPEIVLEIAFDSIQPSKRHNSGLSLRFPRIKAIRRDKTPHEIDTLESAWQLVEQTALKPD